MANTLGTLNGAIIAKRALATLLEEFPFLSKITTDFSDEGALYNQQINVKLPTAVTAGDYNTTTGYVSQDVTQVDVPVTINKHKHVSFGFTDQERSSTNSNLIERFASNAAQARDRERLTFFIDVHLSFSALSRLDAAAGHSVSDR